MQAFHNLLRSVRHHGQYKPNRTGTPTIADVGHMVKYDLRVGFPAVSSRKFYFGPVKGELLGFFRGCDSAAQFRELGCKFWDKNANETPSWLANPNRKGTDDLGRVYGVQWTKWRDTRIVPIGPKANELEAAGYELMAFDPMKDVCVYERTVNQLEEALRLLLTDPYSRRIIVSAWRPDELDQISLPACHVAYQWVLMPDGTLHCTLWIRSNDLYLGHVANAASVALFTHIMARLSGYTPGTVTVFISDAHIYENHLEQVDEQLSRTHFPRPKLVLSDNIRKIENLDDIKGAFERIQPDDIWLEGYQSHPPIEASMAA